MTYDEEKLDRRLEALGNTGRATPSPEGPALRSQAEHRQSVRRSHRRIGVAVAAAVLVAAGVGTGVGLTSSSPSHRIVVKPAHPGPPTTAPAPTTAPTTTPTAPPTSATTPTTAPPPARAVTPAMTTALDAYVAGQAAANATAYQANKATTATLAIGAFPSPSSSVHSAPVVDGESIVAVVAYSYSPTGHTIDVLSYATGGWSVLAPLSSGVAALRSNPHLLRLSTWSSSGVASTTLTAVGPAFLVLTIAATTLPGLVVAPTGTGGAWQIVPHGPEYGLLAASTVVFAKTPHFTGSAVITTHDNCVPDCASGQNTQVRWTYDPSQKMFVATATAAGD